MAKTLICTQCGYFGKPKTAVRGSLLVEIVLWFCFLLPGFIYSVWRSSSRHKVCPKCKSGSLIPADSPLGKKTLTSIGVSEAQIAEVEASVQGEMSSTTKTVIAIVVAIFVIVVFYNVVN